ncbi:FG-GAP-like repeat-containing protein [Streptomyces sp. NPDC093225]|uniref:FG-GAP-like repeat-containing protein n=1 Tax=Streptomyces sp. NPDC093225 TaxID=3366034 RepID=UPI00382D8043
MRKHSLLAAAACAATALAVTGAATATAAAAPAPAKPRTADFNGDGYPDLAIGAHTATVNGLARAGALTVAYGSPKGLRYGSVITQATAGVPGDPVAEGKWREVSATGDFDGDGYDDLLVNWVEKNTILWGSAEGITGTGTTLPKGTYTEADPKLLGGAGGYGFTVLYGPINRSTGKAAVNDFRNIEELDKIAGPTGLFLGDVTGDGLADVTVNGYWAHEPKSAVLKGTKTGLVKAAGTLKQVGGWVGTSAFGDVNGDGYQDLAVTLFTAGAPSLSVNYGGPTGLNATRPARLITLDGATGGLQAPRSGLSGGALAIADTNGDGYAEIVVGAPYKDSGSDTTAVAKAGAVHVFRGTATGVTTLGRKSFTQNTSGVPSASEKDDHFGSAVRILDTDRNGTPELYVGGNGEDGYAGRAWKLNTGPTGITGTGATSFSLTAFGGPSGPSNFGYRFAG